MSLWKKKAFLKIIHVEEESYKVLCCLVKSGQEREVFVNTSYWDVWWPFAFPSALHNPSNHVVPIGENPRRFLVPVLAYGKLLLGSACARPPSPSPVTPRPLKLTEQSIPQALHVSSLSCAFAHALASDGESLLVPQDLDPISSLGAILEFPRTGTGDAFMLHFVLAFTIAVNHRVLKGPMHVSVFPTGKLGDLLAMLGVCPAFFLVLSNHLVNRGCLNIREGP